MNDSELTRLEALKKVCGRDGVQFAAAGYNYLVANIVRSEALRAERLAGGTTTKKLHF
jgi:hypothetical protein